jgi:hypothetical protein
MYYFLSLASCVSFLRETKEKITDENSYIELDSVENTR